MNKIYVVGIGPGDYEQMTIKAYNILKKSDVIVGYTVYVDLVKEHFKDKKFITTPMTKETQRCIMAYEEAIKGQTVSMICSGDAGVYGMSGLMLEIGENYKDVKVEIVSGVTSALSGGALLGAPLAHDFCIISLSDLLTPLEDIKKRIECAAMADFAICLYNPSSKKRADYLKMACDIILKYASEDTVCGYAANIGRQGEKYVVTTLKELRETKTDMFTTVFIGNSRTRCINGRMVTPRGYKDV